MKSMRSKAKLNSFLWVILIALFALGVVFVENGLGYYARRIILLGGIYLILSMGLNIIYGFTGMFSLGQYGFMAIGAYVTALCYLSPAAKGKQFYVQGIAGWVKNIHMGFLPALLVGTAVATFVGAILGYILISKLGGDYLAIATLCFAEIVRVVINYFVKITNGPTGLTGLTGVVDSYWIFGCILFTVLLAARLAKTSYGRALFSIRENEIAAESCGINLVRHKVLAFALGCMLSGLGGALMAFWSGTMDPTMFRMSQNFVVMMIVVIGGRGNITGTCVMSFAVAGLVEWLSVVEKPITIFGWRYPGIYGVKMLVFAVLLLIAIINFKRGLFRKEFSPSIFYERPKFFERMQAGKKGGNGNA